MARSNEIMKAARLRRGLTLSELGKRVDVSHTHLSRVESGARGMSIPLAQKLAPALGVNWTDLVANLLPIPEDGWGKAAVDLSGATEDAAARERFLLSGAPASARTAREAIDQAPLPFQVSPPHRSEIAAAGTVPLFGTAEAGEDGFFEINMVGGPIDYIPRPQGVAHSKDVFAVLVYGESMWPWRTSGDPVYVAPSRPVTPGSHVLITVEAGKGHQPRALIKRLLKRTDDEVVLAQYNPEREIVLEREQVRNIWRILELRELLGF